MATVLYDGACGMCSKGAQRGQRHQREGALRWLDNASDEAQRLLRQHGLVGREDESLIVFGDGRAYLDSDAVVRTARGLRWPWRTIAAVRLVPRPWRDAAYRRIAGRRKRLEACRLPHAERTGIPGTRGEPEPPRSR